jgi:flagellar FliL protein
MADLQTDETLKSSKTNLDSKSEETEVSPTPSKRGIGKIAILAGVIVAQVILAYFLQRTLLFRLPPSAEAHSVETEHKTEKKSKKSVKEQAEAGEMVLLDEIIVNPADTGGRRFLAVTIGFEVTGEGNPEVIERRKPLIRDGLIGLLSSKGILQLADIGYRDTLRAEIRQKIESELQPFEVPRVFFTGYVLQ